MENNADDPRIKHIILWSDSFVLQNRNRIFSTALKVFMKHHPSILSVVHKYCEPGHSSIQEVDNLHSQIERVCGSSKIYSPVGLIRMLKNVCRSRPLNQMKPESFKDYKSIAQQCHFQRVPYKKMSNDCLSDAADFTMPSQLRHLLAIILIFCEPAEPAKLWHQH